MAGDTLNARHWAEADVIVNFTPETAVIPTDVDDPFDSGWDYVGLLDGGQGFSESVTETTTDTYAWGKILIASVKSDFKLTRSFTAYEDNEVTQRLLWPGSSTPGVLKVPVLERVRDSRPVAWCDPPADLLRRRRGVPQRRRARDRGGSVDDPVPRDDLPGRIREPVAPAGDRGRFVTDAVEAEVTAAPLTFEWGGDTWTATPSEKWSFETIEAWEQGNLATAIHGVVGDAQWRRLKRQATREDLTEILGLIASTLGFADAGE
jgi:hypothetical protein